MIRLIEALLFVVADLDAENAIKTLLGKRQHALGIRLEFNRQGDLLRYFGRDAGCYKGEGGTADHRHPRWSAAEDLCAPPGPRLPAATFP